MSDSSVLAAARRARPRVPVQIHGETFHLRVPSMAAVREFQADTVDPTRRVAKLLQECLCSPEGEANLTEAECTEIADMPWMNVALINAIMDLAHGGKGSAEPPADDAGDNPEKYPPAG